MWRKIADGNQAGESVASAVTASAVIASAVTATAEPYAFSWGEPSKAGLILPLSSPAN
jgi:hypothetical protein